MGIASCFEISVACLSVCPIFLRHVWSYILADSCDVGCTVVKEDTEGALYPGKNPAITPNSKHVDIRHHFSRERVERDRNSR